MDFVWEPKSSKLPRQVMIHCPDPEVHARATSGTTIEVVDRRLDALKDCKSPDAEQERVYLQRVRQKLFQKQFASKN